MDDRMYDMSDRFDEIKNIYNQFGVGLDDIDSLWLIKEVEQLRLSNKNRRAERVQIWDKLVKVLGHKAMDSHQLSDMLDLLIRDYHQRGEQIAQLNKELTALRVDITAALSGKDRLSKILENVSARLYDKKAREDITWLSTTVGELRREIKTLARAMDMGTDQTPHIIIARVIGSLRGQAKELAEIHDLLAEALGYYKDAEDDPNSPCPGAYVTGEHTSVTLAMEAARRLESLGTFYTAAKPFAEHPCEQGPREAQYASNGGAVESQDLFELRRELAALRQQCSCPYWADDDQLMPSPNCPTHGVEAYNKKMQGELAMNELRLLHEILLGKNTLGRPES